MLLRLLKIILFFSLSCFLIQGYGQDRPKIGLVLSGGGAAGLAHIGALKVIDRAGIPIDYIAGTSMGSIIGALYAIGYTPEEMEVLVGQYNWEDLMSDQIPRSDLSLEAKLEQEKYFYSFPVNKSGIQLPSGLVAGHNITNMLANLTFPAHHIRNFSELPIPFLCIGADIETGEEVILSKGVLHEAIRASMAIPTYFTPVVYNNRLLIDGGFINNFPVDHAKAMGADFIIGIDVQRDLYKKEDLNSVVNIVKQASSLTREDINKRNRELCDILIRPRTEGANVLSFGLREEIIDNAEKIAMEQWETLEALGKNLNRKGDISKPQRLPQIDSIFIFEIQIEGLEKVSTEYLLSKVDLPVPSYLSPDNISEGLRRAFGTSYFKKLTYQVDPGENGNILIIKAVEKYDDRAHVGLHFDNLFNASLLLNAKFRNIWKQGDQIGIDINLGENPHLEASYYFLTHKRQDFGVEAEYNRLIAYDYSEGKKTSQYNYHDVILDFLTKSRINNAYSLSTGIQAEFAAITPSINLLDFSLFTSKMINVYTHLYKDSYNRTSFPTKGEKVEILAKMVTNFTSEQLYPSFIFNYRHTMAISLGPRLTLNLGISSGLALGDSIPYPYRSYVGGLGYYHKSIFPFVGMSHMERAANHSLIGRADFQFNIEGNHYLLWRNNAGKSFNSFAEFKNYSSTLFGTGLTYGYSTPFGPIEATLMTSNNNLKPLIFINIGYWIR